MVSRDGGRFDIHESGNLYGLPTIEENVDQCKECYDIQTWHEILGHCNFEDINLQGVAKGMAIKGSTAKPNDICEVCIQGKNREPEKS